MSSPSINSSKTGKRSGDGPCDGPVDGMMMVTFAGPGEPIGEAIGDDAIMISVLRPSRLFP